MISSKIIHPYKIKVSKKKRIDTNQTKRIKSKKKVSVHPDVELEKTSSWIRLQSPFLFFISIHVWCLWMLHHPYFHQFLNYWKGTSGFLLLYETRGEIFGVWGHHSAPRSLPLLHQSSVFHVRSRSPSSFKHKDESVPAHGASLHSYGGDPHYHLPVGGGADPRVVGPQLAQDV